MTQPIIPPAPSSPPVTVLPPDLRSLVDALRGDVREFRDAMMVQIGGLAGANKTLADQVFALAKRVERVEQSTIDAKRMASESRGEFSDASTSLARILADQNTAANTRFSGIEKALKDDNRVQMLAIVVVVVAGVLLGTGRIDFLQFTIITGITGGGTATALRRLDMRRKSQEAKT